mgnify:CR=1 FL=1
MFPFGLFGQIIVIFLSSTRGGGVAFPRTVARLTLPARLPRRRSLYLVKASSSMPMYIRSVMLVLGTSYPSVVTFVNSASSFCKSLV